MSRRDFVRNVGIGAAVLGSAAALGACGRSPVPVSDASSGGKPKLGGTLTAGLAGGSAADTLDPHAGAQQLDTARACQLYDALVFNRLEDSGVGYGLAESFEPNADATVWTVKLKSGVEFHNGKTLTSDDVIFTFNRIMKGDYSAATTLGPINVDGMKRIDPLTLQIPYDQPNAVFPESISSLFGIMGIVPTDYDPKNPVGTGPFKYVSFTPGQTSTFVRNPNYWGDGPYIDTLIIDDTGDENTQVNSLLAGQADCISLLSAASIPRVQSAGQALVADNSGGLLTFTMRVDTPPFDDVRVRQAFRLICERPQMKDVLFAGYGPLGNDLSSHLDPAYDRSLPQRHQDIDQAKSLLKAAGHENLTVEIISWPGTGGMIQAAQVFAQQARAAGVTVNIKTVTVTAFFGSQFLNAPFSQNWWTYNTYLAQAAQANLSISPWNDTHFDDPRYTDLYWQALATLDTAKRTAIEHEMQRIEYDTGGTIIPFFPPMIDGVAKRVHGARTGTAGYPLGNYSFKDMWLD